MVSMMKKELLSRLLDDDLNEQEMNQALDALLDDPAAQQSWHSMHTVRAAIDEEGPQASSALLDKITASIETEPGILAPNNLPAFKQDKPSSTGQSNKQGRRMPAYLALAASVVALVTVFNYAPLQTGETVSNDVAVASPQAQMALERELQSMVVQHGEFSGAAALNGLVAYAKVVNGSTAVGSVQ